MQTSFNNMFEFCVCLCVWMDLNELKLCNQAKIEFRWISDH